MKPWSARLREELSSRAAQYGKDHGLDWYQSLGTPGIALFRLSPDGRRHGNFIQESFDAILATPEWRQRLGKPHQRRHALPAPDNTTAHELDSCTSSDALLMNVFCYPGVIAADVAELLQVPPNSHPRFGVAGDVALTTGRADATEVDMQIAHVNVEAKLTESDFTTCTKDHAGRYANLAPVFDVDALPPDGADGYQSYQLIRNVLAVAPQPSARLHVLLDARRPDLLREWWVLHGAIRDSALRARCGFVLWQELAAAAPPPLRAFLEKKYGL